MITVKHHNDGMTIEGHAGYADAGQDIQSVEDLTVDTIDYTMQPGFVDIKYI